MSRTQWRLGEAEAGYTRARRMYEVAYEGHPNHPELAATVHELMQLSHAFCELSAHLTLDDIVHQGEYKSWSVGRNNHHLQRMQARRRAAPRRAGSPRASPRQLPRPTPRPAANGHAPPVLAQLPSRPAVDAEGAVPPISARSRIAGAFRDPFFAEKIEFTLRAGAAGGSG